MQRNRMEVEALTPSLGSLTTGPAILYIGTMGFLAESLGRDDQLWRDEAPLSRCALINDILYDDEDLFHDIIWPELLSDIAKGKSQREPIPAEAYQIKDSRAALITLDTYVMLRTARRDMADVPTTAGDLLDADTWGKTIAVVPVTADMLRRDAIWSYTLCFLTTEVWNSLVVTDVCSFSKSDNCSPRKKIGTFNQIELYDNMTSCVLTQKESESQPHPRIKEHLSSAKTIPAATMLAIRRLPPFSSPLRHGAPPQENSTLIIYKIMPTPFYYRQNVRKEGLEVKADRIIDAIEACIASYCIFTTHISATSLMFPTELIVFRYTVQISGWQNGIRVHQSSITCPAHPICEILNCSLCLEKIYNSQCLTKLEILLATASVMLIISMYWILNPILFVIGRLIELPLLDSTYTRAKRRPRSLKNSALLITILLFIMSERHTYGCSDVVLITSTTESCSKVNSTRTCTFNQVGLLSLRIKSIFHVCQKKIEFFTRDHEFNSESSHRCYKAGSCNRINCDNTKTSDTIAEFSWKASHHPGFTFCKASCQCLMCDGCFYCTPDINRNINLLYLQTVVSPAIWELTVTTEITFQLHNKEPETHLIVLRPGRTSRVRDVKLSLLATVSPQLPVLGSAFITDGKRTAMTMRVQANELTPQTPGQLQCASKTDATQFKCRFSPRTCPCSTGAFKSTCTCPEGKMSNHRQHNTLPFTTKNIIIEQHDDTIAARAHIGSAVHVQTNVENMKIVSVQNHGSCSIMTSTIEGCYSCLLGATVTIVCYATSDQTTADIICDDQHQIATCTQRRKITALNFHFNSPRIDMNCTISCPGGRSYFLINGTLDYVHDSELQREIAIDSDVSVNSAENVWDTATKWISSITDFFGLLKILLIAIYLHTSNALYPFHCDSPLKDSFNREKTNLIPGSLADR
ncbi:hypothetical protein OSTOST_17429 [Ostertagia ostertagi]